MQEEAIKKIISEVLSEYMQNSEVASKPINSSSATQNQPVVDDGYVDDITAVPINEQFFVPNPYDREGYMRMKKTCSARLGIWRTGCRHLTKSTLRFWADHAAAKSTVWQYVDDKIIEEMGFVKLCTTAEDKAMYLRNPSTGRMLTAESLELVKKNCTPNTNVQIVVADGLSSSAIEKNVIDVIPALEQGLTACGLSFGKTFFIQNGRVASSDIVGELTNAEVVVMLVGERPGLNSTSSMGAYITYKPTVGMPESRRTVISNIHMNGTPPVEGGARIADLCKAMVKEKMSGIELKMRM